MSRVRTCSRRAAAPGAGGRSFTAAEVFQCAEESLFYSQALEKLLPIAVRRHTQSGGGGSGDGGGGSSHAATPGPPVANTATSGREAKDGDDGAGSGGGSSSSGGGFKVVEFGTGDGTPVVNALMKTK